VDGRRFLNWLEAQMREGGCLEAFATIYIGIARAIRAHIDGTPLKTAEYDFPTVYDGLRGMQFITRAIESCNAGSRWVAMADANGTRDLFGAAGPRASFN
jgi:hypothetical protein